MTLLGVATFRGKKEHFGILPDDRRRHILIEGKTGMGKTTLLQNLIISDIHAGRGVGLIDPHGDLCDALLACVPTSRTNDVVLFDAGDNEYPVAFNVLHCEHPRQYLRESGIKQWVCESEIVADPPLPSFESAKRRGWPMRNLLEFFSLKDAFPLILLIWLFHFVAARIPGDSPAPRFWARCVAVAVFLFYAGLAVAEWEPVTPWDFLFLSLRALLAMGTLHALAIVAFPVVRFLYLRVWAMPAKRRRRLAEEQARNAEAEKRERETAERNRIEQDRRAEEQRRRRDEMVKSPPPLTRKQRMACTPQRYDGVLGMLAGAGLDEAELRAAREQAKQQYLRELDELLK